MFRRSEMKHSWGKYLTRSIVIRRLANHSWLPLSPPRPHFPTMSYTITFQIWRLHQVVMLSVCKLSLFLSSVPILFAAQLAVIIVFVFVFVFAVCISLCVCLCLIIMLSVCKTSLVCSSAGTSCHHCVSVRGQSLAEANLAEQLTSSEILWRRKVRRVVQVSHLYYLTFPSQYFKPHAEMQNIKYEAKVWQRPTFGRTAHLLYYTPSSLFLYNI